MKDHTFDKYLVVEKDEFSANYFPASDTMTSSLRPVFEYSSFVFICSHLMKNYWMDNNFQC